MELFEGVNAASGVTGGFVATPDHPNQSKWYDDVDAVMASFPAGEAIWFRPDTVYTSAIDGRKVKIKEGKQWVYLEASDECAQVEPMELRPAGVLPTAEPALIEVPGVLDASKLPITAFMSEEALSAEVEWQTFHSDFNGEFGSYMNGELLILLDEVAITEAGIVIDMLTAGEFSMNLRGASLYDDVAKQGKQIVEGIYEFTAASGKTYVGQSGNIAARLEQHIASGKLLPGTPVRTTEVLGGKTAREIAEQLRINSLGGIFQDGIKVLENMRNPIGPARQYLLPLIP